LTSWPAGAGGGAPVKSTDRGAVPATAGLRHLLIWIKLTGMMSLPQEEQDIVALVPALERGGL
jgi:hypothetical protein